MSYEQEKKQVRSGSERTDSESQNAATVPIARFRRYGRRTARFIVELPRFESAKLRYQPERKERVVVTAAHCLPGLMAANGAALDYERTYEGILASLDKSKAGIWAECLFADHVGHVAILGCSDDQKLDSWVPPLEEAIKVAVPRH